MFFHSGCDHRVVQVDKAQTQAIRGVDSGAHMLQILKINAESSGHPGLKHLRSLVDTIRVSRVLIGAETRAEQAFAVRGDHRGGLSHSIHIETEGHHEISQWCVSVEVLYAGDAHVEVVQVELDLVEFE